VSVSQILAILLRRVWIVVLTLLSTIITVGILLQFAQARYEAHATASIDPGNQSDPISASARTDVGLMQGNILSLVVSQRVAMGVLKQLNVNNPQIQEVYGLLKNVDPTFDSGTNVLDITYRSPDPNQAALMANAFLAATIDAFVAMKAAEANQTARWFAPRLDELRKELEEARAALAAFQVKMNLVAPTRGADSEHSQYMAISDQLSNARAGLTALQSRLTSGSTDLSNDPSDPDLQILAGLKQKVTTAEAEIAASKGVFGANNPKMMAQQANLAATRRQISEATEKMRRHLKEYIDLAQTQIASLEAEQEQAQKSLIGVQAQRDQLSQLQSDVDFRAGQLDVRERAAEKAELKSKLTFSAMTVLDKAVPPVTPAFPKPFVALPVGIAAGLALGLILALLAEAADRNVRFPVDLEYSASAPFLGALDRARPSRSQISASRRSRGSA
jgi:polysaccharide biosynthesis transport protein